MRSAGALSLRHFVTVSPPQRGFTLLEMLVALVVLAVGVAGAVLAFRPDEGRRLGQEAERIGLLLEQAGEESDLGGMPLAWVAREDGYEFQRRELTADGPGWVTVRGDDLFHPRVLPTAARIQSIQADGREVSYGERVVLGGQGIQRMTVELTLGGARARVERRPDGRFDYSANGHGESPFQ
jgi:general secretion pathway protein H